LFEAGDLRSDLIGGGEQHRIIKISEGPDSLDHDGYLGPSCIFIATDLINIHSPAV
jgi:hypothetical protein